MKNNHKRILALLMAFALILQYSFSASFMSVYAEGEGEQTEVTQSESKAASEPAPAPAAEEKSEPAPAAEEKSEPAPAPAAEEKSEPAATEEAPAASEESADTAKSESAEDQGSGAVTEEKSAEQADKTAEAEAAAEEAAEEVLPEEEVTEEEEEVKYPADTFKGSAGGVSVVINAPEGALPEGTKLTVTAVSASAVQDAVEGAIGGEAASIKAVDITFSYKGEKIEPKKAVKVHMNASGMANEANQSVVHIADSGSASVVTEAVSNGNATFNSKDFSIYIVVEEDKPIEDENAVATYEFYVGDELKSTQHIKSGDTLVDPGTLGAGNGSNSVFKGWYVGDEALTFGKKDEVPKTETIRVDAKIETTYYVTFRGEPDANGDRGIVAVDTVKVEGDPGTEGTLDISGRSVIPKADTSAFEGWSETADGEVITDKTITVTENKELFAVIVEANWIHFDENVDYATSDSDPTYTGPVYVKKTDDLSSKKPADPTRPGYKFGGWYKEPACTTPFEWSGTGIDKDITLYAKWVPDEAKYTVIIWKQKVTDAKDAADDAKTYDFEESEQKTGTTGQTLNAEDFASYTTHNYTGFHYSNRIKIEPETVKADGSTVVNVYYDRNLLTIRFVDGSHPAYVPTTSDYGDQFGLVDDEYISLTRENEGSWLFPDYHWYYQTTNDYSGSTYRQATGNSGTQYGFVNGQMVQLTRRNGNWYANGQRYRGTRYFEGAQGNSGYGVVNGEVVGISHDDDGWHYTTDVEYTGTRYNLGSEPDVTEYTGLYGSTLTSNGYTWPNERDWYQNPNGGGTRLTFLDAFKFEGLSGVSEGNTILTQYGANPGGSSTVSFYKQDLSGNYPTTATNSVSMTGGGTFTITEKYEGFTAVQYSNYYGTWHNAGAGTNVYDAYDLRIRFERNKYNLTFVSEGETVKTVEGIPYEQKMAQYESQGGTPTKKHHKFVGWCEDPEGVAAFDWNSTMPAANKVLYAKFEPVQYNVDLDANGGKIEGTQHSNFNVDPYTVLNKDSMFQNTSWDSKHELVGWFYKNEDGSAGSVYDYGKIEEDVKLIAKWRMPGQVSIIYDAGEGGSGAPTDNYKYATDSAVVLGPPPTTIKDNYVFVGWKLKNSEGTVLDKIYYVANTFDITEDLISDYNETTKTGKVYVVAEYIKSNEGPFTPATITYNANGGTGADVVVDKSPSDPAKDLLVNEKVTAKSDEDCGFTREGYKFTGWNTDKNGNGLAVAAGDTIAADMLSRDGNTDANTLYAQWVKVYTVTFDTDGGTPATIEDQTVESGKTATKPNDPTKDNNDFLGWFEVVDGTMSDTAFDFSTKITKDTDLKAKWDPKTVTVTFDANGHGTAPAAQTVNKGAKATEPTDPTEAGFTFGGWYTEAACGDDKKFDFNTSVNADITLYAKWTANKYTVNFAIENNNGKLSYNGSDNLSGVTVGDLLYGAETPTVVPKPNAGYSFGGWKKSTAEDPQAVQQNVDPKVTEDVTYTATWTPKTDTEYTVNWYYQTPGSEEYVLKKTETRTGTTGTEAKLTEADLEPEDQGDGYTYEENGSKTLSKVTIAGDGSAEMHVYFWPAYQVTFLAGDHGKLTNAEGEETAKLGPFKVHYGDTTPGASNWEKHPDAGYAFDKWDPAVAAKVTGNATYTAQWAAQDVGYKVEFYYQEDGEYPETATSTDDRTGKTDAEVEVTADDKTPTKDGYVLDDSKSDAWKGTVTADGKLVLKVYFKQQFTVTFDANGHGTAPDAQTVDAGKTASKPEDPKADGFTFGGWFTEAECTNEYDFSTAVMEDKTLYAKWTENEPETFTVTYKYEGTAPKDAPAVPEAKSYAQGETVTVADAPTLDGYTFSGWSKTGTFEMPGENVEITGSWTEVVPEPETAVITYDLNGGTFNGSTANITEAYKVGEVISIHAAPVREGYVFSYWQGSAYQPGDAYTVSGDHTFKAIWVAIEPVEEDTDDDDSDKAASSKGVKTGDAANLFGWMMLAVIAEAGMVYVVRRRRED